MKSDSEKEITRLLKDYLQAELARPEVKRDRELFIETHFKTKYSFAAGLPGFAFGFMATIVLIAGFWFLFSRSLVPVQSPVQENKPAAYQPVVSDAMMQPRVPPKVDILKVASDFGPTMIYQKMHQNIPMTIIWVFPNGVKHGVTK